MGFRGTFNSGPWMNLLTLSMRQVLADDNNNYHNIFKNVKILNFEAIFGITMKNALK